MDYQSHFAQALAKLRDERRYRVFADLERRRRPAALPSRAWRRRQEAKTLLVKLE